MRTLVGNQVAEVSKLRSVLLTSLFVSAVALGAADALRAVAATDQPVNARWVAVAESGGIVYFVYSTPARIERFNMNASSWMSDITLAESPTAFALDAHNLFLSFGRRTSRFALDGTGEVHLRNTPYDADTLFVIDTFLVIGSYGELISVSKTSGALIDDGEDNYFWGMQGVEVVPALRRAIGRTSNVSPADILELTLNADGTFNHQSDSPYHGDYPYAERVYVFPGGARVADNAGIVYNTNNLTYSNSLGGAFDDLTFYGDDPIVLRLGEIIGYSNAFFETGRYKPDHTPFKIFVHGEKVVSFYQGPDDIEAEQFSIDLLKPAEPGLPVDPNGLEYEPDAIALGNDDVLYLLSRANLSIFRWSNPQRRYLETIPLVEAPIFMTYSSRTHRLYLAYPGGALRQIRLAESTHELPFANSPQAAHGLAIAGDYIFVTDPSGAWATHYVYSPDGTLIDSRDWNYYSRAFAWNESNRRMYFFRDDTSPNDIHWEEVQADGSLGEEGESPYHGEIHILPPIRLSPNGSRVIIGSGEIFDADTLSRVDALSNDIVDAAWKASALFTLRDMAGSTNVQKWTANLAVGSQVPLAGDPLRLFARGDGLLAVTSVGGIPTFNYLTDELAPAVDAAPLQLGEGRFSIRAVWRTSDGNIGQGKPTALTSDTGYFWFFSSANVELIVKILDGCAVNQHFWFFAGGLTDVEVYISVTDNETGETRTYQNSQGTAFSPIQDTSAVAGCGAEATGLGSLPLNSRASSPDLTGNRFHLEMDWETPTGASGVGHVVQLTPDTAYLWFFDDANVEAVVKVLDGCAVNGHFWVFAGGLTNVHTELKVTDTATGAIRSFVNPQHQPFLPLQETSAFPCN